MLGAGTEGVSGALVMSSGAATGGSSGAMLVGTGGSVGGRGGTLDLTVGSGGSGTGGDDVGVLAGATDAVRWRCTGARARSRAAGRS